MELWMSSKVNTSKKSAATVARRPALVAAAAMMYTGAVRYLGIDYGEVRLGLALSDEGAVLAKPLKVYARRSPKRDVRWLTLLCIELGVDAVVVGLPLEQAGVEGKTAEQVRLFVGRLRSHLALPVEFVDERYSSAEAEHRLREQGLDGRQIRRELDAVAAALILQTFLDARHRDDQQD
jgi:putative Holliday junction resolvase